MRMCTMAQVPCHMCLAQNLTPHMFHPQTLLYPPGHFNVHFPAFPPLHLRCHFRDLCRRLQVRLVGPESGSMANLNSSTWYEPKYDVDNDKEITPIIFSTDLISDGEQTKICQLASGNISNKHCLFCKPVRKEGHGGYEDEDDDDDEDEDDYDDGDDDETCLNSGYP